MCSSESQVECAAAQAQLAYDAAATAMAAAEEELAQATENGDEERISEAQCAVDSAKATLEELGANLMSTEVALAQANSDVAVVAAEAAQAKEEFEAEMASAAGGLCA